MLVYFFIGTTAELIKVAPVIKEFKKRDIKLKIITSGQVKINFDGLSGYLGVIKPDITLKEKINKSSTIYFIFWALKTFFVSLFTFRKEFQNLDKNTYFIVHGDTVSALIGSFIAKFHKIRLAHIESGLYSHNFFEPFPEEICRNIIDRLSDILFVSNDWAKSNIKQFKGIKVDTLENTLIETFIWSNRLKLKSELRANIRKFKKYYILILHRQEHVIFRKDWSKKILKFVLTNADRNLNCIFVRHPLTIKLIEELKPSLDTKLRKKIKDISPMPYADFMQLFKNAEFIATDGCINQLEAYYMGIPCLALRDRTEQPEGVGKNVVICKSNEVIMRKFLKNYKKYRLNPKIVGDKPSKIIVDYLMANQYERPQ